MKSDLLREARIQHGLSQAKLADVLGVDARTVRRWELGEAIPFPYYRKQLSSIFGKTAEELGLPTDSHDNSMIEDDASFIIAQSTMLDIPASASADSSIPQLQESTSSLLGHENNVPAAQKLKVCSKVNSVQAGLERMHASENSPFSFRFFWDADIHTGFVVSPRLLNRFPPKRLALIGSIILLVVLVMTAVLPAFHWLTSPRSTHTPSLSTIAQAQASVTTANFQNIYTQATSGTPVINDSLSAQSATSWDTYHEVDGGSCAFIDRALRCKSPLGSYGPSPALSNKFSNLANLAIEVSATIMQGDRAAVLLRWHGDTQSGYRFYFTNDGRYTFEFLDQGDEHVLASQNSLAINTGTGQSNTITIIARKGTFYLYINKKYVNNVSDSFLSSGQIAVASDGKSTNSEVAFSNVRVWQL